jgi:Xaa-Pro aminopeptidase
MKYLESVLASMGLSKCRIGAELGTMQKLGIPFQDFERLRSSMPNALFVDASDLLWRLRSVKSCRELEAMREAIALTDRARDSVYRNLGVGMTELGVTQAMTAELARLGSEPGGYVVARHLDSPVPQHDRLFRAGEVLYIDAGAVVRGYVADCCRCVALQRMDELRREGFQILWEIQQAALRQVRAGQRPVAIIHAYRAAVERFKNIHPDIQFGTLSDYIGHGIGMEVCEPPSLGGAESHAVLEEGMTLMIEPSFARREDFYINEEPIVVTETGYELLGPLAPREIRSV